MRTRASDNNIMPPSLPLGKMSAGPIKATKETVKEPQDWTERQLQTFAGWMNFILAPSDSDLAPSSVDAPFSQISILADNSGREGAFNEIYHKQQYDNALSKARDVIVNVTETGIFRTIEREINAKNLQLREDRDILVDVGLQSDLFELLFSYEMSWLKLALETYVGKAITISKNGTEYFAIMGSHNLNLWKRAIKSFVLENFFTNDDIVSQFQKLRATSMSYEKKMKEVLRKFALQRVLSLFYLLDKLRDAQVIAKTSLFVKTSTWKSSKEVLLCFCKDFMKAEGDFSKHMQALGYVVNFKQSVIDEYEYKVSDVKNDLRDGVRLARLVEILSKNYFISSSLRVPAVSRLQKIHNVEKALFTVHNRKEDAAKVTKIAPLIVEGNVMATISLLWEVFFKYEAQTLIDPVKIRGEISEIRSNMAWRRSVYNHQDVNGFAVSVPVRLHSGRIQYPEASLKSPTPIVAWSESDDLAVSLKNWCHAISSQYSIPVYNLTDSLRDGRALCLLIHYYHPTVLPTRDIQSIDKKNFALIKKACQSIGGIPWMLGDMDQIGRVDQQSMLIFLSYLFTRLMDTSQQVRAAIRIQRLVRKYRCLPSRARQSNQIQNKAPPKRRQSTSVVALLAENRPSRQSLRPMLTRESLNPAFMQKSIAPVRIVISPNQAAVCVQRSWRRYCLRHRINVRKQNIERDKVQERVLEETSKLQSQFDSELNRRTSLFDSELNRRKSMFDSELSRRRLEVEVTSLYAQKMEAKRLETERSLHERLLETERQMQERLAQEALVNEERLRNERLARQQAEKSAEQELFERLRLQRVIADIEAQRAAEETRRKELERRRLFSAVRLQTTWRAFLARKQFSTMTRGFLLCQANFRGYRTRESVRTTMYAVYTIQAAIRRYQCQKRYQQMRKATITMQSAARKYFAHQSLQRRKFEFTSQVNKAASYIQCTWKRSKCLRQWKNTVEGVLSELKSNRIHQKHTLKVLKGFVNKVHSEYKMKKSTQIIMRAFRTYNMKVRLHRLVAGFKRLQAAFRARKVLKKCPSKILAARRKVKILEIKARNEPHNSLGRRTLFALQTLQQGTMISHLIKACEMLEFSTQYSKSCCEAFARAGASKVLFGLIRSCNRSTPHQELLKQALVVLLNVARHEHLAPIVSEFEECSDILIDLMQMFRDKKSVFCLASELLCRLVHANHDTKVICNRSEYRKRIEGISSLLERKNRLESRLKSLNSTAASVIKSKYESPMSKLKLLSIQEPIECIRHLLQLLE